MRFKTPKIGGFLRVSAVSKPRKKPQIGLNYAFQPCEGVSKTQKT
jgi:hypothetical protein